MRMLSALIFLFSTSALALPVYNCTVTVEGGWSKKILLSPAFSNRVEFHQTVLDLRVDAGGVLAGMVNGQPNFKISGDVFKGSFESAYHKGTVKCEPEIYLSFVLQFKPWKQYFTVDPIVSRGHIHNSVSLSQVDYGLICFIGDAHETNQAISQNFGVTGVVKSAYNIEFTWEADDCVQWVGGREDSRCVEYRRNKRTKSVPHCYGEPDPRS